MLRESRHEQLLRVLREEGVLPVGEIAKRLRVSAATARRDLNDLGKEGLLTRVYGGAVARPLTERPFAGDGSGGLTAKAGEPAGEHAGKEADKEEVARGAARLIAEGEVVLLDIGTTALQLARRLHGRRITVATGNLAVYEELREDEAVELILLGGRVRRDRRSLEGSLTETSVSRLYADWLFLGASGVLPDGRVLDSTDVEVPVKRAMLTSARQVALLATAGKFPGTGTAHVCGPSQIDVLVTNNSCDPDTLAVFREAGVRVVVEGVQG